MRREERGGGVFLPPKPVSTSYFPLPSIALEAVGGSLLGEQNRTPNVGSKGNITWQQQKGWVRTMVLSLGKGSFGEERF